MFTITNEKRHSAYRRLVGTVYSLSNILKNEKQMDENVQLLLDRLDGFVERKEEIDLGLWLEMYAYDNIGSVFFGKPFGFLDTSSDHGGYIAAVHKAMPFLSVVSMAPTYARMALMMVAITIPSLLRAVLAVDDIRKASVRETQLAMARKDDTQRYDMLSRLIDVLEKSDNSTELTHHEITGEMWVAVIAGADSTAGALRAITYHLIKHPRVMAKLTAEIDQAFESGALTRPMQHSKAITLPYLMAVCKEAARVWPAFQVTMPRYAPAHGLQLPNGFLVPEGYSVGMSPFVVQRDTALFGEDAETFRPERWLEANKELLRQMNTAMISFGAGTRTCTGQHVSYTQQCEKGSCTNRSRQMAMTEIYKIIREIVRRYEVSMPVEREWRAHNASFNLTSGIVCAIRRRDV